MMVQAAAEIRMCRENFLPLPLREGGGVRMTRLLIVLTPPPTASRKGRGNCV